MTTQTLRNGDGKDLAMQPGETMLVVAVTGSYSASIIAGTGAPSIIATNATGGSYGPYAGGAVVRLRSSALSEVDFDIGTAPVVVSDTPVMASKTLTGGIELTVGGEIIRQSRRRSCGIAMALPSSGSIGANGALTVNTAFLHTYANSFMYFPSGAVFSGSPAGMYFVKMTNTTQGVVYANTYSGGLPAIPEVPTPIVSGSIGAYAQTTATDITLVQSILGGGSMGPNGAFAMYPMVSFNNSANAKSFKLFIDGVAAYSQGATTVATEMRPFRMVNQGTEASQMTSGFIGFSASSSSMVARSLNTSADLSMLYTANIASASDYLVLNSFQEEIDFF